MSTAALLFTGASSAASRQAAAAMPTRSKPGDLPATSISEARHRAALGAHELVVLERQGLVFGPGLAFPGEGEVGADRFRRDLDVARRDRARFVKAEPVGADDQQALGVAP